MVRVAFLLFVAFSLLTSANVQSQSSDDLTTVILVRHAERDDDVDALNEAGLERAQELLRMLEHAGIDVIYASTYQRAQETAQPLADALNLELNIYDPDRVNELGYMLVDKHKGETVLVVGHSNVTPMTVNELGVTPPIPNLEHHMYDNMFIVTLSKRRQPKLVTLKFGAKS